MRLSMKLRAVLLLAVVFSVTFLFVFFAIFLTQSAYSTPSQYVLIVDSMEVTLGPAPNATNVPLDTTITVDTLNFADLSDLHVTPKVSFAGVTSENSGSLSSLRTYYPAQPLKPATAYNVSVAIEAVPVSWSFTTTSEPFNVDCVGSRNCGNLNRWFCSPV
jgi:hypothetical protein